MSEELHCEKYRQYFETIRFNQQRIDNLFKFYFLFASSLFGFLGWVCRSEISKISNNDIKCGLPEIIYKSIRPWSLVLIVAFSSLLILGILIFFFVLIKRRDDVQRIKILNSNLDAKEKIDTKCLSIGDHWIYIFGVSFLNSISICFIIQTYNIVGRLSRDKSCLMLIIFSFALLFQLILYA
ncbi:MAG: hypothetical protein PHY56_06475, partial [Candidatus Omnitrophica bacterium]|nr:hypothetical protein [Candidatus Omnitrophota bacterium]